LLAARAAASIGGTMATRARPLFLVIGYLIWSVPAHSQSVATRPDVVEAVNLLDIWLSAQRDYNDIPGISAGVVSDQELIWSKGYGFANVANRTPARPSTVYSICSISKLFTSVSVMQLRDQGKLRLDDEVASILPWMHLTQRHPRSAPITVEGILTHSSGLPRESDFPYWTDPFDFPTHDEIVARLSSQETLYPAWTYFQYSNLGLTLAGEIVAQVSGQPFHEYVRRHVLDPLNMRSTTSEIGDVWNNPNMATGYSASRRDGHRKEVRHFSGRGIAPAMGFASTVEDLAKFASWQFRLLQSGDREILEANTLREMQRVHWVDPSWETTWGLGFSVYRRDGKTFVGHGGACPGFLTQLQLQLDEKIATIAMVNANGTSPGLLARRAYEIVAPALKAARDTSSHATSVDRDLAKYVGSYDSYPWGGEVSVIPWKGDLAIVPLPTDDPLGALTRLKHIDGNRFRRVRDDETLAEEIVFETDANGLVLRMWQHSNSSERIR
jgi:CubicO group peptidase (beta-lactamase class C family)